MNGEDEAEVTGGEQLGGGDGGSTRAAGRRRGEASPRRTWPVLEDGDNDNNAAGLIPARRMVETRASGDRRGGRSRSEH